MFKYPEDINFTTMTPKAITATTAPTAWQDLKFAPAPRTPDTNKLGPGSDGAVLVAQYVEGYLYRTYDMRRISDDKITAMLNKAREKEPDADADDYPQLKSLLDACQDIGLVCNGTGGTKAEIGFVNPVADHLKYYIRQYGQLIIETKITSTTYNQHEYDISAVGEDLGFDDYSKGFIAYGYDASWIYAQNSLGPFAGSLGFHRISWNVVPSLVKRGVCWWLKNPA